MNMLQVWVQWWQFRTRQWARTAGRMGYLDGRRGYPSEEIFIAMPLHRGEPINTAGEHEGRVVAEAVIRTQEEGGQ